MALDFNTPKSGTVYHIGVSGTVAARTTGYARIELHVTGSHPTRNDLFYKVIEYANTTSSVAVYFHGTYPLTVTPKQCKNHVVTPTLNWSYLVTPTN